MKASSCCSPIVGSWCNSTHSRMRSSLAKHIVQRLSSKRVRQIEIRVRSLLALCLLCDGYLPAAVEEQQYFLRIASATTCSCIRQRAFHDGLPGKILSISLPHIQCLCLAAIVVPRVILLYSMQLVSLQAQIHPKQVPIFDRSQLIDQRL